MQIFPSDNNYKPISQKEPMSTREDRGPSKNFSGKLPFRTTPDIHEDIFFAAKQSGKSINAWMEEILKEAAKQKREAPEQSSAPPSHSLQKLFQEQPDTVFELIDTIKPELKSHKTRDTVSLMGEVERLVASYELIRAQVNRGDAQSTANLLNSAIHPLLKNTQEEDVGKDIGTCVTAIEATIAPRLKQQDVASILECIQALGQFLVGVVTIRLYLKDDSLENTLLVAQNVIRHLST
jgi:hypothetical protein